MPQMRRESCVCPKDPAANATECILPQGALHLIHMVKSEDGFHEI